LEKIGPKTDLLGKAGKIKEPCGGKLPAKASAVMGVGLKRACRRIPTAGGRRDLG